MVGLILFAEGCSRFSDWYYAEDHAKAKAEENAKALEKERRITESLWAMGGAKAADLLLDCRSKVGAKADELKPFSGFVVEETSADVYQVAGSRVTMRSMRDRAKELKALVEKKDPYVLMGFESLSKFTVIETKDTFEGPKKFSYTYACKLDENLAIDVWKMAD